MATYQTPGVYTEEIPDLPPSIIEVDSAIPVFIGFTEKGNTNRPQRLSSLMEFELHFGKAQYEENIRVDIGSGLPVISHDPAGRSKNILYYALQLYFANGGGACYIVSAGSFKEAGNATIETYAASLEATAGQDEPSILIFPDAPYLISGLYYGLMDLVLQHCAERSDRFLIMDVLDAGHDLKLSKDNFRIAELPGLPQAGYGAAYYPNLFTAIAYQYRTEDLKISGQNGTALLFSDLPSAMQEMIRDKITDDGIELTPCAAVAGIYVQVDRSRGVWKAPASVALALVKAPSVSILDVEQDDLSVDPQGGRSINVIRSFTGKGVLVWGARTLAGNDNEWRYVSVRRFAIMIEESVKRSTAWAIFEPNDENTWTKIRTMIENYLQLKWRQGALAGSRAADAFFVKSGLGQTMTLLDILEGRLIIEIGIAMLKPAEFVVLRFSHKLAAG